MRPDGPLIRHLCETVSFDVGRSWQRMPYMLLPGGGYAEYLLSRGGEFAYQVEDIRLPWPEVIFDFPTGVKDVLASDLNRVGLFAQELVQDKEPDRLTAEVQEAEAIAREAFLVQPDFRGVNLTDRGRCWVRLTTADRYLAELGERSPWYGKHLFSSIRSNPQAWLAIEFWESQTLSVEHGDMRFPIVPDVFFAPMQRPWDFRGYRYLYVNQHCMGPASPRAFGGLCNLSRCPYDDDNLIRLACMGSQMLMDAMTKLALYTLAYLEIGDEYLVEVTPNATAKEWKNAERGIKPWTDSTLPHWILVDPRRVKDYGHPSGQDLGGTHATPRPHQRRGHWRELRAERFKHDEDGTPFRTYIKPTWVGDEAWMDDEGKRYKLLSPLGR